MPGSARRVLVVGGGVAAVEAMLALRAATQREIDLDLHLLAPDPAFTYRAAGVLAAFTRAVPRRVELRRIAADLGATLHADALDAVDLEERHVVTARSRAQLEFDDLLVAAGARAVPSVPGATPYRGDRDAPVLSAILGDARRGSVHRVVIVVPEGVRWSLPAYEMALLATEQLAALHAAAEVVLVTAEERPLEIFGAEAGETVARRLSQAGVELHVGVRSERVDHGVLWADGVPALAGERFLALPRIAGPAIAGLPHDADGFLPVDPSCRVRGTDVFAAGDVTTQEVKQGGLAAQQADVAAGHIAARAGALVVTEIFQPVLRGMLVGGAPDGGPLYLRADLRAGRAEVSTEAPWWPGTKLVGLHLGGYLAALAADGAPAAAAA